MVNIESLPKVINFNNILYSLQLHITAWNKICVCYSRMFKPENLLDSEYTIISQVVEPDMKEEINYSDDVTQIIDVPNITMAWNILSSRLNTALADGTVTIEYM